MTDHVTGEVAITQPREGTLAWMVPRLTGIEGGECKGTGKGRSSSSTEESEAPQAEVTRWPECQALTEGNFQ